MNPNPALALALALTRHLEQLAGSHDRAQAEVGELDVPSRIEQQILRLQVASQ